jgi:hypothetical protein
MRLTRSRSILAAVVVVLAYGIFSAFVWSVDFAEVDSAIADLGTLTRAQIAYADLNGGFNEADLSCLHKPGTCIPTRQQEWRGRAIVSSFPADTPQSARWLRRGRYFVPGTQADVRVIAAQGLSPSSVQGFRYVVDVNSRRPWWASAALFGRRVPVAFCADAGGRLCELHALPTTSETICPADCRSID